jgi:hypoxanthine phosphoribosyltransferase
MSPFLLTSEKIQKRVAELGLEITKDYEGRTPHLICVLKGASIFHSDLVRAIALKLTYDFITVSSYEGHTESSQKVRILNDLTDNIQGRDVLVVEDIVDTGLTLYHLLQLLKMRNPKSLKVITLLDKLDRRNYTVPIDYIGFLIPNRFVVGYGLDYQQRYRNLPHIMELPK